MCGIQREADFGFTIVILEDTAMLRVPYFKRNKNGTLIESFVVRLEMILWYLRTHTILNF